ncbi:bacitracin transport system permease protein [Gracilibacillus halotolerans]|uniref:Bacitracin transport system permease protein n=1 Tax=Gracilibacillus halotolerans TaxID=74386 RepID=A0A841RKT2_9BACI|nr:ABC transporter permease [Gracilibacillus halotolerans]MBB6513341.1 bacitracin transport system permease protein [Gracilibacillus halotolerans]
MKTSHLIVRNLMKNLKNYALYVFALILTVTFYFAFVTLQYDPSMDATSGTIKGEAGIRAGTVLLIVIAAVFLLYANSIFIKRRSNEIALFQLIGMSKVEVFRILVTENAILYFGSLLAGIGVGFSISKLMIMILFKITGINAIASLHFSIEAFTQTLLVFSGIFVLVILRNWLFIRKQSITSLFQVTGSTELKITKMSIWQMASGLLGLLLVATGYYLSQEMFSGDFVTANSLFLIMILILFSVIIGTYLFYKSSVSFIFYLLRKKQNGYLSIRKVLSLATMMFRMKSNALLLTVITTITALAVALLCLSYITYYSSEQNAHNMVAGDFAFVTTEDAESFTTVLNEEDIDYTLRQAEVIQVMADLSDILDAQFVELELESEDMPLPITSDEFFGDIELDSNETMFTGYNDFMQRIITISDSGFLTLKGNEVTIDQDFIGLERQYIVSSYFDFSGGMPLAVVDQTVYAQLKEDVIEDLQQEHMLFTGINIEKEADLEKSNEIFLSLQLGDRDGNESRLQLTEQDKRGSGLYIFIVGFLGLTFLVTSGCVLYFKQVDESEEEKNSYTILRKLGFTKGDLISGIWIKQLFNFGIPLVVGLLHSYFAVKSGWFLFGTELWKPMAIVMGLYACFYSLFGILSVLYFRKVIDDSL